MAVVINDDNFDELVMKSNIPVVIDFWAEWCGPCKMMSPIIDELHKDFQGKAVVGKVDVDSNPASSAKFGIRNIPTILFIKDGKVVDKQVGVISKSALDDKLKKIL